MRKHRNPCNGHPIREMTAWAGGRVVRVRAVNTTQAAEFALALFAHLGIHPDEIEITIGGNKRRIYTHYVHDGQIINGEQRKALKPV